MSCTRSLRHWLSLEFQLLRRKSLAVLKPISLILGKRILRARRTRTEGTFLAILRNLVSRSRDLAEVFKMPDTVG